MSNFIGFVALAFACYDVVYNGFSASSGFHLFVILLLARLLLVVDRVTASLEEVVEILNEEDEENPGIYHPPYEIET
jgi:hypothetical protein